MRSQQLHPSNPLHLRFADLTVTDCGQTMPPTGAGISANGTLITHCVVSGNRNDGIQAAQGSAIVECIVNRNGEVGITIADGLVNGVVATENGVNLQAMSGATVVNTHAP